MSTDGAAELDLVLTGKQFASDPIAIIELQRTDHAALPSWTPGSHIEIALPTDRGRVFRRYSLSGPLENNSRHWRIAVLREVNSRGGSAYLCDRAALGQHFQVSCPANYFPFLPDGRVTFIAGGIGITPVLPMVQMAHAAELDWHFIYLAKSLENMVFLNEIYALPQDRVTLHCSRTEGRFDVAGLVREFDQGDSIYACGPRRLLDDLEFLQGESCRWRLHLERFENPNIALPTSRPEGFEILLARSRCRFLVRQGESILEVLRRKGFDVSASCCEGVCRTCVQRVIEGIPEHRDAVLSPQERRESRYMMVCVSRSVTPTLTLDL